MPSSSDANSPSDEEATDTIQMRARPSDRERMARAAGLSGVTLTTFVRAPAVREAGASRAKVRPRRSLSATAGRCWRRSTLRLRQRRRPGTRCATADPGLPVRSDGEPPSVAGPVIEPSGPGRRDLPGLPAGRNALTPPCSSLPGSSRRTSSRGCSQMSDGERLAAARWRSDPFHGLRGSARLNAPRPVQKRRSPAPPGRHDCPRWRAGPGLRGPSIQLPGFLRADTRVDRLRACRDTGRDR